MDSNHPDASRNHRVDWRIHDGPPQQLLQGRKLLLKSKRDLDVVTVNGWLHCKEQTTVLQDCFSTANEFDFHNDKLYVCKLMMPYGPGAK